MSRRGFKVPFLALSCLAIASSAFGATAANYRCGILFSEVRTESLLARLAQEQDPARQLELMKAALKQPTEWAPFGDRGRAHHALSRKLSEGDPAVIQAYTDLVIELTFAQDANYALSPLRSFDDAAALPILERLAAIPGKLSRPSGHGRREEINPKSIVMFALEQQLGNYPTAGRLGEGATREGYLNLYARLFKDADPAIQHDAVFAFFGSHRMGLGRINSEPSTFEKLYEADPKRAIRMLVDFLDPNSPDSRAWVYEIFATGKEPYFSGMGSEGVSFARKALATLDPQDRVGQVRFIKLLASAQGAREDAVLLFVDWLQHPEPQVRKVAMDWLANTYRGGPNHVVGEN